MLKIAWVFFVQLWVCHRLGKSLLWLRQQESQTLETYMVQVEKTHFRLQLIFDPIVRNQAGKERERRLDKVFVFFQRAFC